MAEHDDRLLPEAVLRIRLAQTDAHYGGNLIAGAKMLEIFGDVATELCIRYDGDESLFAGYEEVAFLKPVFAGQFIEARGRIVSVGTTSRKMEFEAYRYAEPRLDINDSAADVLDQPVLVTRAVGTCVVPRDRQRKGRR